MLLSLRENGLSSLFKEVRAFKVGGFEKALTGFSVEAAKPHSGSFSVQFGSDSEGSAQL